MRRLATAFAFAALGGLAMPAGGSGPPSYTTTPCTWVLPVVVLDCYNNPHPACGGGRGTARVVGDTSDAYCAPVEDSEKEIVGWDGIKHMMGTPLYDLPQCLSIQGVQYCRTTQ